MNENSKNRSSGAASSSSGHGDAGKSGNKSDYIDDDVHTPPGSGGFKSGKRAGKQAGKKRRGSSKKFDCLMCGSPYVSNKAFAFCRYKGSDGETCHDRSQALGICAMRGCPNKGARGKCEGPGIKCEDCYESERESRRKNRSSGPGSRQSKRDDLKSASERRTRAEAAGAEDARREIKIEEFLHNRFGSGVGEEPDVEDDEPVSEKPQHQLAALAVERSEELREGVERVKEAVEKAKEAHDDSDKRTSEDVTGSLVELAEEQRDVRGWMHIHSAGTVRQRLMHYFPPLGKRFRGYTFYGYGVEDLVSFTNASRLFWSRYVRDERYVLKIILLVVQIALALSFCGGIWPAEGQNWIPVYHKHVHYVETGTPGITASLLSYAGGWGAREVVSTVPVFAIPGLPLKVRFDATVNGTWADGDTRPFVLHWNLDHIITFEEYAESKIPDTDIRLGVRTREGYGGFRGYDKWIEGWTVWWEDVTSMPLEWLAGLQRGVWVIEIYPANLSYYAGLLNSISLLAYFLVLLRHFYAWLGGQCDNNFIRENVRLAVCFQEPTITHTYPSSPERRTLGDGQGKTTSAEIILSATFRIRAYVEGSLGPRLVRFRHDASQNFQAEYSARIEIPFSTEVMAGRVMDVPSIDIFVDALSNRFRRSTQVNRPTEDDFAWDLAALHLAYRRCLGLHKPFDDAGPRFGIVEEEA